MFICIQWIRFILSLTPAKDNTLIWDLVSGLQARAVPAVSSELMLALVDGNLDALYGRGRHIWMSHTHVQLFLCETGQSQTHRVGVKNRVKGDLQSQDFIGICPRRENATLSSVPHKLAFKYTVKVYK